MTNNAFKKRLIFVFCGVTAVLIISLIEYLFESGHTNTFIGSNSTLFALLGAAYLAFVFQQRGKFVDDLRKWWNEIVEAKSAFFVYCDKKEPTEADYFNGFYKLSTAMDTLRLIYCNVDRTSGNSKGYYPFEQVRDIIDLARSIEPKGKPTAKQRLLAKQAIHLVFQSLRHAIQSEASASIPDDPTLYDSEYRARYVTEIVDHLDVDIETIRKTNKEEDYASRREKIVPRPRSANR